MHYGNNLFQIYFHINFNFDNYFLRNNCQNEILIKRYLTIIHLILNIKYN